MDKQQIANEALTAIGKLVEVIKYNSSPGLIKEDVIAAFKSVLYIKEELEKLYKQKEVSNG